MRRLLALIDKHFDSTEEAAELLDSLATELEQKAEGLYAAVVPGVVRGELDGAFSKNAERMVGHASRELDRSLARFFSLRDQLLESGALSEDDKYDDDQDDGPVAQPAPVGPDGDDSADGLARIEAMLDQLLESDGDEREVGRTLIRQP